MTLFMCSICKEDIHCCVHNKIMDTFNEGVECERNNVINIIDERMKYLKLMWKEYNDNKELVKEYDIAFSELRNLRHKIVGEK